MWKMKMVSSRENKKNQENKNKYRYNVMEIMKMVLSRVK